MGLQTPCWQHNDTGEYPSGIKIKPSICIANHSKLKLTISPQTFVSPLFTFLRMLLCCLSLLCGNAVCTPLYKIFMRLATIDSVATMQTLRENLQNLGVFVVTVNGNINKIHGKFDRNHLQLLARGTTVDDPIGLLFDACSVVPCHNL